MPADFTFTVDSRLPVCLYILRLRFAHEIGTAHADRPDRLLKYIDTCDPAVLIRAIDTNITIASRLIIESIVRDQRSKAFTSSISHHYLTQCRVVFAL